MWSTDLEATSYMLQLLLLDKTTRYLYFLCTTFPLPPTNPGDGDTETPSPVVLTWCCHRRMVQNLPNQVFTQSFDFLLYCCWVHVLSLCSSFHCFVFLTYGHALMKGEKAGAEKLCAWPVLYNLNWDVKRPNFKPKKTTPKPTKQMKNKWEKKQEKVSTIVGVL